MVSFFLTFQSIVQAHYDMFVTDVEIGEQRHGVTFEVMHTSGSTFTVLNL